MGADPRWEGVRRAPTPRRTSSGSAARCRVEHTLARLGAERLWELLARRASTSPRSARSPATRPCRWCKRRAEGDLPLRLAGRGRREPRGADLPRPEPLPGEHRARRSCGASTTRCGAPTRSRGPRASGDATGSRRSSPTPRPASAAPLNAFELMKSMIEAGAAGVHFEDQLASEKKCGHLGGKVLVPTAQFVRTLDRRAAGRRRLRRADGPRRAHRRARGDAPHERRRRARPRVPDRRAHGRGLLPRPRRHRGRDRARRSPTRRTPTCSGARPRRRTSTRRASSPRRVHGEFPASCSRTTARRRSTGASTSTTTRSRAFQRELGDDGLQLPVRHARRDSTRSTCRCSSSRATTRDEGMTAYVRLQEREFALEEDGYTATRHQREVGAGYFDRCRRSSPAARRPRSPSRARPRRSSSAAARGTVGRTATAGAGRGSPSRRWTRSVRA